MILFQNATLKASYFVTYGTQIINVFPFPQSKNKKQNIDLCKHLTELRFILKVDDPKDIKRGLRKHKL